MRDNKHRNSASLGIDNYAPYNPLMSGISKQIKITIA